MSSSSGRRNGGRQHLTHCVYFTDRGIEKQVKRRGEEQVTIE
ncbi:DUF6104 family protein [Streptomyces sp. NPDC056460]